MPRPPAPPAPPVRATLLLALLAVGIGLAACGTKGDNTLGVSLIDDQAQQKAVRFVSLAADSGTSYQGTAASGDPATAVSLLVSARPGYLARALLRFPNSVLPGGGAVIDSAWVTFPYRDGFGTTSFALEVHRGLQWWEETNVSPDSFPVYDPVAAVTMDVPFPEASLDTFSLSLTALAQAWSDDTTTNFGIVLVPAATETGELAVDSREATTLPRLTVHWTAGGADSSRNAASVADLYSLGTTPAFVPLPDEPRRVTVARGFAARSILRFPWADPGARATIHRAELTLHPDAARSASNGFAVGARRVAAEPWNGFDTDVEETLRGVTTVAADQDSVVLDVTGIVIGMLDGGNHGVEIRASDERPDTDYLRFHGADTEDPARAPTLRVWWTPGDELEAAP